MKRNEIIEEAVTKCLKELYSYAQPKVEYDDFIKECEDWSKKYYSKGKISPDAPPKPYEFYYLDSKIMKEICSWYIHGYRLDQKQDLLDDISTLKNYCNNPIVKKYIKDTDGHGYRGYDEPENLENELVSYLSNNFPINQDVKKYAKELQELFFKFLDMAGNFYNWTGDLNKFNVSVYLGISPNSNKERVIENWKKYRNKDIEINDLTIDDIYE